jgi:hypothetical protein
MAIDLNTTAEGEKAGFLIIKVNEVSSTDVRF